MTIADLHNIRQDYSHQELSAKQCDDNPLQQFQIWLNQAIETKVHEPTAMNLACVDSSGRPNARMVLLKELNERGFVFFTNYQSRKGQALSANPFAALTFFWPELERQVRIEGHVERLTTEESNAYFQSRPYLSRIGAHASRQSAVLPNKAELMAKVALLSAKYPFNIPRPEHWGGYIVIPDRIQFWQGRPSRLHDRIQYSLNGSRWIKERLSP